MPARLHTPDAAATEEIGETRATVLSHKQKGVALGMGAGVLVTALIVTAPSSWFGIVSPPDLPGRLTYAIHADAVAMLWLLAAVANVARRRFFSPSDIDGGGLSPASDRISVDIAVVQNTLEQSVLASVLYASLACVASGDDFLLIPQLLTLFCIGRLTFWLGYRHGAPWRALASPSLSTPRYLAMRSWSRIGYVSDGTHEGVIRLIYKPSPNS